MDFTQVGIALGFKALSQGLVFDWYSSFRAIDCIEASRCQAAFTEGSLPGSDDFLGIVLAGSGVELVQNVKELARIRSRDRAGDEVIECIPHCARFGMTCIEKDQHEIGKVHDVIRDSQGRGPLGIGIEARGVDQDLAANAFGIAGLHLQVAVDTLAFALGNLFDVMADAIEGKARVCVERNTGKRMARTLLAETDDGEFVVNSLVATALQLLSEKMVDEGRFSGREGSQDGDQRPPGDLGCKGLLTIKQACLVTNLVELLERLDRLDEYRIFVLQVPFKLFQSSRDRCGVFCHPDDPDAVCFYGA